MKKMKVRWLAAGVMLALVAVAAWPGLAHAASQMTDLSQAGVQPQAYCSYTVAYGNTLSRIAVRYGTTIYALAAMNGLYNPNFIYSGMVLRVPCSGAADPSTPSGTCSYYLVRRGDYLKAIAARFGTTWQAIAQANRLYTPNLIYAGMRLAIPCSPMSAPGGAHWKSFASIKHHYTVNYPADWTISVQTSAPGWNPEYVSLHPSSASLPIIEIYALKGEPPIKGFENCDRNLIFRGISACSFSLPKGQQPAQQMLVFQKGDSHYQLAIQYETQQQLGMFEEVVRSFQFTP